MSFYTALTGLNGSQADISASSNNIANVGTTGFKRSRAEFGDIFATSPLQNSSSSIGSGTIIKGVKQQFTQGNIASSLNALDLAISGQGFFCLKPSLTSSQTVYTRNGSFNVDNNRNVVDSSGQFLLTYPVNEDGSVTAKDLDSALPLQLPVTSGAPQATSNIDLAVNLDSGSLVVPDLEEFSGGYVFDPNNPNSFTNSTSLTIFDDLGNPTIATVYFIKTQSSADARGDGNNKFDTRLVINDTIIDPNLVPSVDEGGSQIFIDRFGKQMTEVPDDNFFLEGKGSVLYKLDDLNQHVDSEPARMTGQASAFDFGAEGNNLVEIVNDPMLFKATREAGNNGNIYWGKDFLAVSVDNADTPVSIDLRPGQYNAQDLAAEVERAINAAYGDDRKLQVRSNVDDKLTIDLFSLGATGALSGLSTPISVDLLQESYVTQQRGIDVEGASPDFLNDEFLAHSQLLINKEMNNRIDTIPGASANQFARAISDPIVNIQEKTEVFKFDYTHREITMSSLNVSDPGFSVSFSEGKISVNGTASLATATDVSFQIGTAGDMRSITASIPGPSGNPLVYQTAGQIAGHIKAAMDVALEPVQMGVATQTKLADGTPEESYAVEFDSQTETFTVTGGGNDVSEGTLQFILNTSVAAMDINVTIAEDDTAEDIAGKIETAIAAEWGQLNTLGIAPFDDPTGDTSGATLQLSGVNNAIPFHAKDDSIATATTGSIVVGRTEPRFMMHSFFGEKPALTVYDKQTEIRSGVDITYQANNNILLLPIGENHPDVSYYEGRAEQKIMLAGTFSGQGNVLNGRELKIDSVADGFVRINTSGMGFPEADFEITATNAFILSDESDNVEAFFEGAGIAPEGSAINFNNKRIVLREKPEVGHGYSDDDIKALTALNIRDFSATDTSNGTDVSDITFSFNGATMGNSIGLTVDWEGTTTNATTVQFKIDSLFGDDINVDVDIAGGDTTSATLAASIKNALDAAGHGSITDGNDTYTLSLSNNTLMWSHTQTSIFTNIDTQIDTTNRLQTLTDFGLTTLSTNISDNWVDELDPPVTIEYDNFNQAFKFGVNHTQIGPGTDGNFRAISVSGSPTADSTNNLGIPDAGTARAVTIGSDTQVLGQPFVTDGTELQISAKRFGVDVAYNSDSQTFTFASGTSGEEVPINGALSVTEAQPASNIQVGRYSINAENGEILDKSVDSGSRTLAVGNSDLMGVGSAKSIFFQAGRGLQSDPAVATGASANEPLNEIFAMSDITGDTTFNISVNGVAGIIKVPPGNYVGGTLASALETRINQISSPSTGVAVGGVKVAYIPATNNFTFTTGTTSDTSTIKVKGAARLGLDDVALGVGSVPQITNLVQATNADGVPLYVDENGETVLNPPANLVEDFYPLYLDEGEITFSKSGEIVSPKNKVRYEQQASGFSISLDMDYSASTQLATPFAVNNLNQDGFTSGRLDGLEIDATGLLRANYTNGQNKPLGKLVMANFNNQNGLKQIGNATYVETAVSGTPTVGEAGSEGFGSIQSGSLERSNVDITEELVNLITAQRNFQASSKAIETSTQLTQTIIQIRT
ncbi:flagellar hook-basal body complex protein [Paracoccaceae bacterium]|nr:flagellar hook-basal body complex protein [Paracoccaceae bacterium]